MTSLNRCVRLTLCLSLLAFLGAVPSVASAASPAWHIIQTTNPTNLVPGTEAHEIENVGNAKGAVPAFHITIRNVGGAKTSGAITVTDTLPAGVSPVANAQPEYTYLTPVENKEQIAAERCGVVGQTVTCEIPQSYQPFQSIEVAIPLAVGSLSSGTVRNEVVVEGGGAPVATNSIEVEISHDIPPFSFIPDHGFAMNTWDLSGNAPLAGTHPFFTEFALEASNFQKGPIISNGAIKDIAVELPEGFVVNPNATTVKCTDEQLNSTVRFPNRPCPPASQIGVIELELQGLGTVGEPLYNMTTPPGAPSDFGFTLLQVAVHIIGGLNGDFRLDAHSENLLSIYKVSKIHVQLWGNPSDPRFDRFRYGAGCQNGGCPIEPSPAPLLTMPTACGAAEDAHGRLDSWLGATAESTKPLADRNYEAINVSGCNALAFQPTIEAKASTNVADSPSGLQIHIHQPQNQSLEGTSTATLKDVTVRLPEGMTVNSASANGLNSCSEGQMGFQPGGSVIRFSTAPQACPSASKLGSVEAKTPLIDHPLSGQVFLAKPYENPFHSLLAIYLAVEDEATGIYVKLAGEVKADPVTGQLTTTFRENPELPIEDISLNLFEGAGAPLKTPLTCGSNPIVTTLTPWSTPEGSDATPSDSSPTTVPAGGIGPCPANEAAARTDFGFSAGTVAPSVGSFSPFVLKLTRPDGAQHLTSISTTLPAGLLAKLAGVPYCSEGSIALSKSREIPNGGALEQRSPSCPAGSEVGTVNVGTGAGPTPFYVTGHAYLAGPYKSAPISLVIITPAVAGPFDLGTVVTRVALNLGLYSAQVNAVSDPLPTIIDGIPVDVRSVALKLDRPGFTVNPTSCEKMQIAGLVSTQSDATVPISNHFQVGGCANLSFKPKLALSLKGGTKRAAHPALKAVLKFPGKGSSANVADAQVGLPHSEFLDQGHISTVCSQAQLAATSCPAGSVYGKARAWIPLLDQPLQGNVYLAGGFGYKLPALVAELNGQLRVLIRGKIDTDKQGGIRSTFEAVPDAPVSKFVLELAGGKKGLLVNSTNICKSKQKAEVKFIGQNGKVAKYDQPITNSCKSKHKKKHGKPKS